MEAGKKRLATLVGCNYFNTRNELHGCINDVESMTKVIVDRFGFEPEDIVVLTDVPSSAVMPTGANIRQALRRMVDRAEPGDVLFFHYSGHGTLIPAVKPHHGRAKRDEAIVPCDFNLITDVDFRELVDRLPPGVSFTIISDSCHSGGLIDQEKEQVGPTTVTNETTKSRHRPKTIPFADVMHHLSSLSSVESDHIGDHLLDIFGSDTSAKFSPGGVVRAVSPASPDDGILLSGCQTNETSADMNPEEEEGAANGEGGGGGSKAYGAFSNAIQEVLKREKGRLRNREIVLRARGLLKEQGFSQHPCLYCSDENAKAPFLWQPEEGAAEEM